MSEQPPPQAPPQATKESATTRSSSSAKATSSRPTVPSVEVYIKNSKPSTTSSNTGGKMAHVPSFLPGKSNGDGHPDRCKGSAGKLDLKTTEESDDEEGNLTHEDGMPSKRRRSRNPPPPPPMTPTTPTTPREDRSTTPYHNSRGDDDTSYMRSSASSQSLSTQRTSSAANRDRKEELLQIHKSLESLAADRVKNTQEASTTLRHLIQIFRSFKFASDRIRTLEACGKKPRDYVGLLTPFLAARDRNVRSLALKALRLPLDETAARRILHHRSIIAIIRSMEMDEDLTEERLQAFYVVKAIQKLIPTEITYSVFSSLASIVEENADPARNMAVVIVKDSCLQLSGDHTAVLVETGCIDALVDYLLTSSSVNGFEIDSLIFALIHFISKPASVPFQYSSLLSPVLAVFAKEHLASKQAKNAKRQSSHELGTLANQLQRARQVLVTIGRTWVGAFALGSPDCGWTMINTTISSCKDEYSKLVLLRALLEILSTPRLDYSDTPGRIKLEWNPEKLSTEASLEPVFEADLSSGSSESDSDSIPMSFGPGDELKKERKRDEPHDSAEYGQFSFNKPFLLFGDGAMGDENDSSFLHEATYNFWVRMFDSLCRPLLKQPEYDVVKGRTYPPWSHATVSSSDILDCFLAYNLHCAYKSGIFSTLSKLSADKDARVSVASRVFLSYALASGKRLLPSSTFLAMIDTISSVTTGVQMRSLYPPHSFGSTSAASHNFLSGSRLYKRARFISLLQTAAQLKNGPTRHDLVGAMTQQSTLSKASGKVHGFAFDIRSQLTGDLGDYISKSDILPGVLSIAHHFGFPDYARIVGSKSENNSRVPADGSKELEYTSNNQLETDYSFTLSQFTKSLESSINGKSRSSQSAQSGGHSSLSVLYSSGGDLHRASKNFTDPEIYTLMCSCCQSTGVQELGIHDESTNAESDEEPWIVFSSSILEPRNSPYMCFPVGYDVQFKHWLSTASKTLDRMPEGLVHTYFGKQKSSLRQSLEDLQSRPKEFHKLQMSALMLTLNHAASPVNELGEIVVSPGALTWSLSSSGPVHDGGLAKVFEEKLRSCSGFGEYPGVNMLISKLLGVANEYDIPSKLEHIKLRAQPYGSVDQVLGQDAWTPFEVAVLWDNFRRSKVDLPDITESLRALILRFSLPQCTLLMNPLANDVIQECLETSKALYGHQYFSQDSSAADDGELKHNKPIHHASISRQRSSSKVAAREGRFADLTIVTYSSQSDRFLYWPWLRSSKPWITVSEYLSNLYMNYVKGVVAEELDSLASTSLQKLFASHADSGMSSSNPSSITKFYHGQSHSHPWGQPHLLHRPGTQETPLGGSEMDHEVVGAQNDTSRKTGEGEKHDRTTTSKGKANVNPKEDIIKKTVLGVYPHVELLAELLQTTAEVVVNTKVLDTDNWKHWDWKAIGSILDTCCLSPYVVTFFLGGPEIVVSMLRDATKNGEMTSQAYSETLASMSHLSELTKHIDERHIQALGGKHAVFLKKLFGFFYFHSHKVTQWFESLPQTNFTELHSDWDAESPHHFGRCCRLPWLPCNIRFIRVLRQLMLVLLHHPGGRAFLVSKGSKKYKEIVKERQKYGCALGDGRRMLCNLMHWLIWHAACPLNPGRDLGLSESRVDFMRKTGKAFKLQGEIHDKERNPLMNALSMYDKAERRRMAAGYDPHSVRKSNAKLAWLHNLHDRHILDKMMLSREYLIIFGLLLSCENGRTLLMLLSRDNFDLNNIQEVDKILTGNKDDIDLDLKPVYNKEDSVTLPALNTYENTEYTDASGGDDLTNTVSDRLLRATMLQNRDKAKDKRENSSTRALRGSDFVGRILIPFGKHEHLEEICIEMLNYLDFSLEGSSSRTLVQSWLLSQETAYSLKVRVIQFLRLLLREGTPGFTDWAIDLLVAILYLKQELQLSKIAISILSEAAALSEVYGRAIVQKSPPLSLYSREEIEPLALMLMAYEGGVKLLAATGFLSEYLKTWRDVTLDWMATLDFDISCAFALKADANPSKRNSVDRSLENSRNMKSKNPKSTPVSVPHPHWLTGLWGSGSADGVDWQSFSRLPWRIEVWMHWEKQIVHHSGDDNQASATDTQQCIKRIISDTIIDFSEYTPEKRLSVSQCSKSDEISADVVIRAAVRNRAGKISSEGIPPNAKLFAALFVGASPIDTDKGYVPGTFTEFLRSGDAYKSAGGPFQNIWENIRAGNQSNYVGPDEGTEANRNSQVFPMVSHVEENWPSDTYALPSHWSSEGDIDCNKHLQEYRKLCRSEIAHRTIGEQLHCRTLRSSRQEEATTATRRYSVSPHYYDENQCSSSMVICGQLIASWEVCDVSELSVDNTKPSSRSNVYRPSPHFGKLSHNQKAEFIFTTSEMTPGMVRFVGVEFPVNLQGHGKAARNPLEHVTNAFTSNSSTGVLPPRPSLLFGTFRPLPIHFVQMLSATREGQATLLHSGVIQALISDTVNSRASIHIRRAALWSIGMCCSTAQGYAFICDLVSPDIPLRLDSIARGEGGNPPALRADAIMVLGFLGKHNRGRYDLDALGWNFAAVDDLSFHAHVSAIPLLEENAKNDQNVSSVSSANIPTSVVHPGEKATPTTDDVSLSVHGGFTLAVRPELNSNWEEVLSLVARLQARVSVRDAKSALSSIRKKQPHLFLEPGLYWHVQALMTRHRFAINVRRFVHYLFDKVSFSDRNWQPAELLAQQRKQRLTKRCP